MISKVNNSVLGSVYANNTLSNTQKKENASATTATNQEGGKIEQLKESIDFGKYKVDLSALSKKMADELL